MPVSGKIEVGTNKLNVLGGRGGGRSQVLALDLIMMPIASALQN